MVGGQVSQGRPHIAVVLGEDAVAQRLVVVGLGGGVPVLRRPGADLNEPAAAAPVDQVGLGVLALDRLEVGDGVGLESVRFSVFWMYAACSGCWRRNSWIELWETSAAPSACWVKSDSCWLIATRNRRLWRERRACSLIQPAGGLALEHLPALVDDQEVPPAPRAAVRVALPGPGAAARRGTRRW